MLFEVAKVLPKFQVTLPKEVREFLEINNIGERIVFLETSEGLLLRRLNEDIVNMIINQDEVKNN